MIAVMDAYGSWHPYSVQEYYFVLRTSLSIGQQKQTEVNPAQMQHKIQNTDGDVQTRPITSGVSKLDSSQTQEWQWQKGTSSHTQQVEGGLWSRRLA